MSVLKWDKPAQVMDKSEWAAISADSAYPGVYTPNMSDADQEAWKAKLVGHKSGDPRVEIRKRAGALMLIVVRADRLVISANGKIELSAGDFNDMLKAIAESDSKLREMSNG